MEQAVSPAKAVDPLQWVDCGSIPGCRRLNITWKYDVEPLGVTKVGATDAGLRVSTVLAFLKGDDHPWPHYAIFDANGPALAVWRSSGAVTGCLSFPPAVSRNRVWYGVLDFDSGATAYIHPTYDELMVVSSTFDIGTSTQRMRGSDSIATMWGMTGNTMTIYDRLAATAQTFGSISYPQYKDAVPMDGGVLLRCHLPAYPDHPQACIWTQETKVVESFITVEGGVVPMVARDGNSLVWIEASGTELPDNTWASPVFYKSPYANKYSALQPQSLGPAPPVRVPPLVANDGYIALNVFAEKKIHIYRISDWHHWSFDWPASAGKVWDVLYVDSAEVWLYGQLNLVRQELTALGPGEPGPQQ